MAGSIAARSCAAFSPRLFEPRGAVFSHSRRCQTAASCAPVSPSDPLHFHDVEKPCAVRRGLVWASCAERLCDDLRPLSAISGHRGRWFLQRHGLGPSARPLRAVGRGKAQRGPASERWPGAGGQDALAFVRILRATGTPSGGGLCPR